MSVQRGVVPQGVYVAFFNYGSPATRYRLNPGRRIVEVHVYDRRLRWPVPPDLAEQLEADLGPIGSGYLLIVFRVRLHHPGESAQDPEQIDGGGTGQKFEHDLQFAERLLAAGSRTASDD